MMVVLAVVGVWLVLAARFSQRFLQFFQIEEYDTARFYRWFLQHYFFFFREPLIVFVGTLLLDRLLALELFGLSPTVHASALAIAWLGGGVYLLVTQWKTRTQVKKPLVYTQRARRLLGVSWLVLALLPLAALLSAWPAGPARWLGVPDLFALQLSGAVVGMVAQLAPLALIAANGLLYPFEAAMRQHYVRQARRRLRDTRAVALGITGSYGKTSTKDMLAALLAPRYKVVKSPQSYNTLLGICKIINRGDVQPAHEYFVVEAGAYQRGEIASICALVSPRVGVLTAIGPQHLERFGTVDEVARAKYEIVAPLPADGLAVLNGDDERCYALAQQTSHVPVALYGFQDHLDELTMRAEDVQMTAEGARFTLVHVPSGERVACQTRLLGTHTVSNLLAAATVAHFCGLALPTIAQAIAALPPTPHRLELKPGAGGTVILDDSYNSNPIGARNALETLALFDSGQRILVTPGFVELGSIEAAENQRLGEVAAQHCDYALLVGPTLRTGPIWSGLLAGGFAEERMRQVPSLHEAIAHLRTITQPGDAVLLLNDLPDTYELVAASPPPAHV